MKITYIRGAGVGVYEVQYDTDAGHEYTVRLRRHARTAPTVLSYARRAARR